MRPHADARLDRRRAPHDFDRRHLAHVPLPRALRHRSMVAGGPRGVVRGPRPGVRQRFRVHRGRSAGFDLRAGQHGAWRGRRARSAPSDVAMPIREFFHLIHVVDDMDEANEWYDALFSPQCFQPKGYAELEKRWATLSMIGDFMIEVIEPSDAPDDQQAPLPKFRGRFGQHFHSLSFFVDVPDLIPLFKRLRMNGVRIAKPGGGMFADGDDVVPGNTIFTHPKDTFGQIEFEGLNELWQGRDPRFSVGLVERVVARRAPARHRARLALHHDRHRSRSGTRAVRERVRRPRAPRGAIRRRRERVRVRGQ